MTADIPLLAVEDLRVDFLTRKGVVEAVRGSFEEMYVEKMKTRQRQS